MSVFYRRMNTSAVNDIPFNIEVYFRELINKIFVFILKNVNFVALIYIFIICFKSSLE